MPRLLYLVAGTPGSGRLEILQDLLNGETPESPQSLILSPREEGKEADNCWWCEDNEINLPEKSLSAEILNLFLVLDPLQDLADQMEATQNLLAKTDGLDLGRILFVVHCGMLDQASNKLQSWNDACAHFADIALLNRREGISNRTIETFRKRYESMRYPMTFELIKKNRLPNPARVLDPTPRRISHAFDPPENFDLDETPAIDPYLERLPGGERAKPTPIPFEKT